MALGLRSFCFTYGLARLVSGGGDGDGDSGGDEDGGGVGGGLGG